MRTFFNGANCDIYIGQGAGKKLLDDITNAKRSVKIVSSVGFLKRTTCGSSAA